MYLYHYYCHSVHVYKFTFGVPFVNCIYTIFPLGLCTEFRYPEFILDPNCVSFAVLFYVFTTNTSFPLLLKFVLLLGCLQTKYLHI